MFHHCVHHCSTYNRWAHNTGKHIQQVITYYRQTHTTGEHIKQANIYNRYAHTRGKHVQMTWHQATLTKQATILVLIIQSSWCFQFDKVCCRSPRTASFAPLSSALCNTTVTGCWSNIIGFCANIYKKILLSSVLCAFKFSIITVVCDPM